MALKITEYCMKQENNKINIYTDEGHFASQTVSPPYKVVEEVLDEWLQERVGTKTYFD